MTAGSEAGFRPNLLVRMADFAASLAELIGWHTAYPGGPEPVGRTLKMVVTDVYRHAPDVVGLRLTTPVPRQLPGWRPGAHVDVELPSGRVRQYSLCGDPADITCYRVAVRLLTDGDGGSREIHGLSPGATVTIRGPRNAFPLVDAPAYRFLAGGIGITPIVPMVHAAAAGGADWRLVHTGRDRASMPLSGELATAYPQHVLLRPDDEHGGLPDVAELLLGDLPPGAHVYCCGPLPMIEAARRATPVGHGFHAERFTAATVRGGRPFTLELARSGKTVQVAAGRSALESVRTVLPEVAFSCRQGFCGTCHVRLLDGAAEHNTALPGHVALCVARAANGRLVVDR